MSAVNWGLFALLAGFLLPLALSIRLGGLLALERGRGLYHPLNLVLWTELLLAAVPVVALAPTAWTVTLGGSADQAMLLLDFHATGAGFAKLAVNVVAVLVADLAIPRIYDQLVRDPISVKRPTVRYLLRDLGVLATCLLLAWAAAVHL